MSWLRRRSRERRSEVAVAVTMPVVSPGQSVELVPVAAESALLRTERAVFALAVDSAQLHDHLGRLEQRIDHLAAALLDRVDVASYQDVLDVRMHSARVAAELSRLEVNLAARLDAVRHDLAALADDADVVDIRDLQPTDTGWTDRRTG